MLPEQIQALESYFKTDNEHWNSFAFKMLCQVLEGGQFENPELPLHLFSCAIDIFTEHHQSPLNAVGLFEEEIGKNNLSPSQRISVYGWVCEYLKKSEFDFDQTQLHKLIESQSERLKAAQPAKPVVKNIRDTLKELMHKELEQLPETLKGLEPAQRLNVLCKLMPFVLPKVEAVHSEKGELS